MTRSFLRIFDTTIFHSSVDTSKIVCFELLKEEDSNQNENSLLDDFRGFYRKRKFSFLFGSFSTDFFENSTKHRFIVSNKLTNKGRCQKVCNFPYFVG